jgi:phage/plasmid-like protein (TIGR03299 family)
MTADSATARNVRVDVRDCKTGRDVLAKAGFDFKVGLRDAYHLDRRGNPQKVETGHRVVVREDTGQALSVVGSRFVPVQSEDFVSRLDPVVRSQHLTFVSAAFFDHGRVMVVEAQLPKPIVLRAPDGKDDVILRRVLWKNAHDGTQQVSLEDYLLRQWCTNGATRILGKESYFIRHTSSAQARMSEAAAAVQSSLVRFDVVEKNAQLLAKTPFAAKQMERVAARMYPSPRAEEDVMLRTKTQRAELVALFKEPGRGTFGRTAWDAVNALTAWGTHERRVRDAEGKELSRLRSMWLGNHQVRAGYAYVLEEAGVREAA